MRDKASIIKIAQKYTAKGQLDKAIAEWEKLLDQSNDGNIHNTIGDLYLRKGSEQQAIESFKKSADIFHKDGFYPKAIAVYKKVINLVPNNVDALIAMAKLNAERGLIGNAVENYFRAAEIFNREGQAEKATQVVERILQLSPSDIGTSMKAADMYIRIGHRGRAANEYASVGSVYLQQDEIEQAREMFRKASDFDEDNVQVFIGLGKIAEKENNIEQAFEYIEKAMNLEPNNKEVLLSHANLSIKVNRTKEAADTLLKLIDAHPSDMKPKHTLCELYVNEGEPDKAWDAMLPQIDRAIEDKKWEEANEILGIFKDINSIPVKERQVNICRGQEDSDGLMTALKELAELIENKGSEDEALQIYKEALELDPDNTYLADKIKSFEVPEEAVQSEQGEVHADDTMIMDNSVRAEAPAVDKINEPEAPQSEQVEVPADDTVIMDNSVRMEVPAEDKINEPEAPLSEQVEAPADDSMKADNSMHVELTPDVMEETAEPEKSPGMAPEDFIERKAEADFFAQQGLNEEALHIYKELLALSPDNEELKRHVASIEPASAGNEGIEVEKDDQGETVSAPSVDDDLQEIFNQFEKPAEETEIVDYESHYSTGLEYKQKGLIDEAIKELQIAAKDPEKKIRNSTMLALCYQEQGNYPLAITEFSKIIESMTPADSTYLHVKYELAKAYLNNKNESRAFEVFSEIQDQSSDFKDVAMRVASLKAEEQGDKPKPKKDRVSYI